MFDSIMLIRHISFPLDSLGYLAVYKGEIKVQKLADLRGFQRFWEHLSASDGIMRCPVLWVRWGR